MTTDRRNPVTAALSDLCIELLNGGRIPDATTVAKARGLYLDWHGERKPAPRKRPMAAEKLPTLAELKKATGVAPLAEPGEMRDRQADERAQRKAEADMLPPFLDGGAA